MDILEQAKEVFEIEAQVLKETSRSINENFLKVTELVHSVVSKGQGRIIVSGVGKSGIVARKWVSTFSSTGTPSFFLNPMEAAHGEMGAMCRGDVLFLLSFSGETAELFPLVRYAKEMDLPIIVVCAHEDSSLGKSATYRLLVNVSKEACPLGLAPTASSTVMLALGDALAVCLMKMSGFSSDDFSKRHPGGFLGRRALLRVSEAMHSGSALPTVQPFATMDEALIVMTEKKLGAVCVVEGPLLRGIITDGDLRRFLMRKLSFHSTRVQEVMSPKPITVSPNTLLIDAKQIMLEKKVTQLVVSDSTHGEGTIQGLLHIHDLRTV